MTEPLPRETIDRIASLARLKLTDAESELYADQLAAILGYVEQLSELDTEGVEPMAHAVESHNVFREDVSHEPLPREESLSNAPQTDGEYFLVPQIIVDQGDRRS